MDTRPSSAPSREIDLRKPFAETTCGTALPVVGAGVCARRAPRRLASVDAELNRLPERYLVEMQLPRDHRDRSSRAPPRTPVAATRGVDSSHVAVGDAASGPRRRLIEGPVGIWSATRCGVDRPRRHLAATLRGPQPPRAAGALMRTDLSRSARGPAEVPPVADDRSRPPVRRSSPRLDGSNCLLPRRRPDWAVNEEEPKSDALSWSVEEQREIDQALQKVWESVVENAPLPPNRLPTTVPELSPMLVARYREHRIPYVVIHPARLYLAHPKWPKTVSEPLDERTMYYCERDVAQQTQKWKEAAANKGLVQFEAPTDACLYHPRNRKDWPQPLLSSHEEEPGAGTTNLQAVTGKTEVARNSIAVGDTYKRRHSATEEDSAAPSSKLPKPVLAGLQKEWSRLWDEFRHDVTVATNSLLYMLEGVHSQYRAERQRLVEANDLSGGDVATLEDALRTYGDSYASPTYPRLRAFPTATGEPLFSRAAPGGSMEQMLLKAWVIDIYSRWESTYRNQLKHESRHLPGAIRPLQQVLGDLGHIRNDLFHNGIAKRNESGRCEILRWFKVGDRMHLRLRHVFDFLNQMSWLTEGPAVIRDGPVKPSAWQIDRTSELELPAPALVSVRPFVNPLESDTRYRYGASIAFENGVFVTIPMGPEREETPARAKDRARKWIKMTVNEAGDLSVPGLGTVSADSLYRSALNEEKYFGAGIPGPWIQFRK